MKKVRKVAKLIRKAAMVVGREEEAGEEVRVDPSFFVSTGCTLLNLAISEHPLCGFMKGKYYFLVGDSTSGKTFFSMTCFAEACQNPAFKDYRLIYNNPEDGMLMDVERLFGFSVAHRIEPPAVDSDGMPVHSETIEEFYYHVDDALEDGRPFFMILDSMDALDSVADKKKFDEKKKAHKKGNKETAGSYGMAKAKANSTGLRQVVGKLRSSGSILIIISQTRDNVDAFSFEKKTRSGGRALKFYATVEIWTSLAGQIKKTVRKKPRLIGNKIQLRVKKNRITGRLHTVTTAIYPSYGVDDIGSNIDYLLDEGWWRKSGQTINAKGLFGGIKATRPKLISMLGESPRAVRKLQRIVGQCWAEIQAACDLNRNARYE